MRLIAVGRLRAGPEAELFTRYAGRLRPALAVTEIAEGRGTAVENRRREAAALLAAIPETALVVALDESGPPRGSETFAGLLQGWREMGRTPCFLIGGADGLACDVLARADATLSLGLPTWPHMLVRVLLAEQLYRAQSILAGHPYHRGAKLPS